MKTLAWLALVLMIAAGTAFAQDDAASVLTGTEKPESRQSSDKGQCLVYRDYVVKTTQSEDGGENVAVYRRDAAGAKQSCQTGGKALITVPDADNNSFFGIAGGYLFVDSGTSAESRSVETFNLATRRSLIKTSYSDDPKLTAGRFLLFDATSARKGLLSTCKEAAKWKREGGGVRWVQGMKLDLQTLVSVKVGGLRCAYME